MTRPARMILITVFIFTTFLFIFQSISSAELHCIIRRDESGRIYQDCHEFPHKPIGIMPTLTRVFTPTPIHTFTRCETTDQCMSGYECYQPPMPPCPKGRMCPQVMPAKYCKPITCPLRSQGDANCDQQINEADFLELRKKLNNQPLSLGSTTDFNLDGRTDMIDYEIWRTSVYK